MGSREAFGNETSEFGLLRVDCQHLWCCKVLEQTGICEEIDEGFGCEKSTRLYEEKSQNYEGQQQNKKCKVQMEQGSIHKNWAELFAKKVPEKAKLCCTPPIIQEGKVIAKIKSWDFKEEIEECLKMVMGYYMGKRIQFSYLREALARVWGTKNFEMDSTGETTYCFRFKNETDKPKALDKGLIYIASRLFVTKEWTLETEMEPEKLSSIPIWVIL